MYDKQKQALQVFFEYCSKVIDSGDPHKQDLLAISKRLTTEHESTLSFQDEYTAPERFDCVVLNDFLTTINTTLTCLAKHYPTGHTQAIEIQAGWDAFRETIASNKIGKCS